MINKIAHSLFLTLLIFSLSGQNRVFAETLRDNGTLETADQGNPDLSNRCEITVPLHNNGDNGLINFTDIEENEEDEQESDEELTTVKRGFNCVNYFNSILFNTHNPGVYSFNDFDILPVGKTYSNSLILRRYLVLRAILI